MKKQIFLLVLALFAALNSVIAQPLAVPGTKPRSLSCATDDPLNPIAGNSYDYSALIGPTGGTAYWYATQSTTFTTAGVRAATEIPADGVVIASGATNYRTGTTSPTSPSTTKVTWTANGLAGIDATHPMFMVVEYSGPTCANNIKVMQIIPAKSAFTVDITNMTHGATPTSLGYDIPDNQCFANIVSAKYNAGKIDIDYGINILYFEVIGANFDGSYKPTLKLTGLQGAQTAAIDWGVNIGTYDQALVADQPHTSGTITSSQFTVLTNAPSTSDGVSIYVRVTVSNHGFEGTNDETITLAAEAVDSANNPDVMPDCNISPTQYEDVATQTLNLRPTVTTTPTSLVQNP
jgi:hypothetical protein